MLCVIPLSTTIASAFCMSEGCFLLPLFSSQAKSELLTTGMEMTIITPIAIQMIRLFLRSSPMKMVTDSNKKGDKSRGSNLWR
jgi:hypothetical protein